MISANALHSENVFFSGQEKRRFDPEDGQYVLYRHFVFCLEELCK